MNRRPIRAARRESPDYEMDDDTHTSRHRKRPQQKASSDEASLSVESGDEHEHDDGGESDHPSDEESQEKDQKQKSKPKPPKEEYHADPLDLTIECIITDRDGDEEEYLVKFKGLSYHEVQWITEAQFAQYSPQCQMKLKRYFQKRDKLRSGQCQPENANLDEGEFFDAHYTQPDKLILCTNLFPMIHPRQAKTILDTWRERCVLVHQLICNFKAENHPHATSFLHLRTDETPHLLDLATINNRLYTIPNSNVIKQQQQQGGPQTYYLKPSDYWQDLGSFLRQICAQHGSMDTKEGIFAATLRELAYYLYITYVDQINNLQTAKPKPDFVKDIRSCIERKNNIEQQIKTIKSKNALDIQSQALLGNLYQQNSAVVKEISLLVTAERLQDSSFPSFYIQNAESESAYSELLQLLPSYLQSILAEQPATIINNDSVKMKIQEIFVMLKPKDLTENVVDGALQLGSTFMQSLVTGEQAMTTDLSWLLMKGQTIQSILEHHILEADQIKTMLLAGPTEVDPLYLVKWGNLSHLDCTWEHASLIRKFDPTQTKLKDFERFNRSLDGNARQKLTGFSYAHKQLLKIYEKKLEQGKKIDSKSAEEQSTREMLSKLLKFEGNQSSTGYFQYDYSKNLVPQFRLGQQMKDYQIDSLNWMLRAFQDNRNIVLADEMGLGKTIQSMALLDHLIKINKIRGPFLVLAPLSTLDHWKTVAEQWTFMNVVVYHDRGGQEGRLRIRDTDWYYTDITNKGTVTQKSKLTKFNLMITTYEVFNADISHLKEVPFQYVVIDEAHRLKNANTKTLSLLKEHPVKRILLLTGTPVQNNTKELFTLLNYIEGDKFSSYDKFMQQYGTLQSAGQVDQLKEILKPHFLRRMKDEVEKGIPPLSETVVDIGLTTKQQEYYKGIYGENLALLAQLGSVKNINLNNIDMQLRKCCNHLFLLKGVEEEVTKNCVTEQDYYEKTLESSGKLQLLDKFIDKYKSEGHKMLVFSQFKGMVEIIQNYLKFKQIRCEVLTGTVKSQDRVTSIQRFNEDDQFGVFLLTTRAGGLGINLTKARVVVIFDSDWNPQNDLQAIARAHRIGQKFEIEVYRLITAKTYEQQMFDRASKKLGMEQALFQKGAFGVSDQADVNKVDPAEVEKLLKYGVYAFLNDDQQENSEQNAKIEDILKNKHKPGKSKVQKTTFNVKEEGRQSAAKNKGPKVNVDDPDFWDKVLPQSQGFTAKTLMRRLKQKKGDICTTHENQKKFIQEVGQCVQDIIDTKQKDPAFVVEEDVYELLKRISKMKDFAAKYRATAQAHLELLLNSTSMVICDSQRFGRKAKNKTDYSEKAPKKKGKKEEIEQVEEDEQYTQQQEDLEESDDQIADLVKPEELKPNKKKRKRASSVEEDDEELSDDEPKKRIKR